MTIAKEIIKNINLSNNKTHYKLILKHPYLTHKFEYNFNITINDRIYNSILPKIEIMNNEIKRIIKTKMKQNGSIDVNYFFNDYSLSFLELISMNEISSVCEVTYA